MKDYSQNLRRRFADELYAAMKKNKNINEIFLFVFSLRGAVERNGTPAMHIKLCYICLSWRQQNIQSQFRLDALNKRNLRGVS